jgi:hypothetical protein
MKSEIILKGYDIELNIIEPYKATIKNEKFLEFNINGCSVRLSVNHHVSPEEINYILTIRKIPIFQFDKEECEFYIVGEPYYFVSKKVLPDGRIEKEYECIDKRVIYSIDQYTIDIWIYPYVSQILV